MTKTFRTTFKWALAIVLVGAIGGGIYAYNVLHEWNDIVREAVVAWFEERGYEEGRDFDVGKCSFDLLATNEVRIHDLVIKTAKSGRAVLAFPGIELTVDRAALAERQDFDVRGIRIYKPKVILSRRSDGTWNFSELPAMPPSDKPLPEELLIEDGTILFQWQEDGESTQKSLVAEGITMRLVPHGHRDLEYQGELTVRGIESPLQLNGAWDIEHGTWTVMGELDEFVIGQELAESVERWKPGLVRQLAEKLEGRPLTQGEQLDSRGGPAARGLPPLGFDLTTNVKFKIARLEAEGTLQYSVLTDITRGEIVHPRLPYRIDKLHGQVFVDPTQIVVSAVTAHSGELQARADGTLRRGAGVPDGRINVDVKRLPLDQRLRGQLPESLGRIHDLHEPSGTVDFNGDFVVSPDGTVRHENCVLSANGCRATFKLFPYPVSNIGGTVRQDGNDLIVNLTGRAGRTRTVPVTLSGRVRDPGPSAEAMLRLSAEELYLDDDALLESFNTMLRPVRRTLDDLNLKGVGTCDVRLYRPPVAGTKMQFEVFLDVRESALEYDGFPYRVSDLLGRVHLTQSGDVRLTQLLGRHESAVISGNGYFRKADSHLHLALHAEDVPLDADLKAALPDNLKELWKSFAPSGNVNLTTEVDWNPDMDVSVKMPQVLVTGGGLTLTEEFPYRLRDVTARFRYFPGLRDPRVADPYSELKIDAFEGSHDGARVTASGFSQIFGTGDWRLTLDRLDIKNLRTDRDLLTSLPEGLREAMEYFNPTQPVDHAGSVELRGSGRAEDPITAYWDVTTTFRGGTVSAGLDLEDIHGTVTATGEFDGTDVRVDGDRKSVV